MIAQGLMRLAFGRLFGWQDAEDHGLDHRRIRGVDGSLLALALARTADVPPRGVVLLCHPLLKYGKSYFWHANDHRWLTAAGYHAIGFDFKGFGASQLRGISFADDVASVALWARQQFSGLPLHLLGVSFGACHGIHCLARPALPLDGGEPSRTPHGIGGPMRAQFTSAVFDSAPVDTTRFFGRGWVGALMRRVAASRWGQPTGMRPIVESLPAAGSLPCLFLYGGADPFVTPAEIEQVRQACRGARIQVFDGCGHLQLRKQRRDDYIGAVLAFFASHAAPAHGTPAAKPAKDAA